jgi:peptidoglycan/xylan/chitin deacetylase (PgdA/CDA1 family)
MTLRTQVRSIRQRAVSSMCARRLPLGNRGPIVSFTFDDFPRSALTIGGAILRRHGARGTYYAAAGLMDSVNHLGEQFRREDLDTLLRDGHELASHTFGHISCRSVSSSAFVKDIEKGRRAIESLTGSADFGNFAYPFGEVTLNTKRLVGPGLASARGIWGGLNTREVDLNLLRANSLYGGRENDDQVRSLILENERIGGWLIFYSHDVATTPSRYGCTADLLEFAVSLATQRRGTIATVADVVSGLRAGHLENECVPATVS